MNDRARALNGKLRIRSANEQGTTVELQFPI
jgi:signal transduction histidine kinase